MKIFIKFFIKIFFCYKKQFSTKNDRSTFQKGGGDRLRRPPPGHAPETVGIKLLLNIISSNSLARNENKFMLKSPAIIKFSLGKFCNKHQLPY